MAKLIICTVAALAVFGVEGSDLCSCSGQSSGNWFGASAPVLTGFGSSADLGYGSADIAVAPLATSVGIDTIAPSSSLVSAGVTAYGPESTIVSSRQFNVPSALAVDAIAPSASLLANGVSNSGPQATLEPIRTLNPIILAPVEAPIRALPAPALPSPVVIAHKCSCTKTVEKPQLFQRLIQVQKNQRFLKRTYRPVVEKIAYCARPKC